MCYYLKKIKMMKLFIIGFLMSTAFFGITSLIKDVKRQIKLKKRRRRIALREVGYAHPIEQRRLFLILKDSYVLEKNELINLLIFSAENIKNRSEYFYPEVLINLIFQEINNFYFLNEEEEKKIFMAYYQILKPNDFDKIIDNIKINQEFTMPQVSN